MTSTIGGGMKNREPLKADWIGPHLMVVLSWVPGPGARSFWAKIMRWLPFHGPGGPTLQIPHGKCSLGVGATGRSPHRPAAFCGSRSNPPGGAPPSRCFLPRSSLPPGHNRSFQELSNS